MAKGDTRTPSRRVKLPRILVVEANAGYRSVISHVAELAGGQFESVAEIAGLITIPEWSRSSANLSSGFVVVLVHT